MLKGTLGVTKGLTNMTMAAEADLEKRTADVKAAAPSDAAPADAGTP